MIQQAVLIFYCRSNNVFCTPEMTILKSSPLISSLRVFDHNIIFESVFDNLLSNFEIRIYSQVFLRVLYQHIVL